MTKENFLPTNNFTSIRFTRDKKAQEDEEMVEAKEELATKVVDKGKMKMQHEETKHPLKPFGS